MAQRFAVAARITATLLVATPLAAQRLTDPMELMRLQSVLQRALDHVAPSVVRIETFGGARRTLGPDAAPRDDIAEAERFRYTPRDLEALFDKIDPDELSRLWKEKNLEPKAEDEPFEPRDRRHHDRGQHDRPRHPGARCSGEQVGDPARPVQ